VTVLKRVGVPMIEVGVPSTFAEVRQQYRDVAAALGEQARGERLVAEMDDRLATFPSDRPGARPRAMLLNPNGYTVGRGSLIDEIITRAGFENVAATLGLGKYGYVPLEVVTMNAIDVLIVSASRDGPPALATETLRHPVLTKPSGKTRVIVLPSRLWNCSGPELVQAIEQLAQAAQDVRGEARRE
jgi:iron complex transport system substrate-binding protein